MFDKDGAEVDEVKKPKSVEKRLGQLDKAATAERKIGFECRQDDRGMFACTRPAGHVGMHIAQAGTEIVHMWS